MRKIQVLICKNALQDVLTHVKAVLNSINEFQAAQNTTQIPKTEGSGQNLEEVEESSVHSTALPSNFLRPIVRDLAFKCCGHNDNYDNRPFLIFLY